MYFTNKGKGVTLVTVQNRLDAGGFGNGKRSFTSGIGQINGIYPDG